MVEDLASKFMRQPLYRQRTHFGAPKPLLHHFPVGKELETFSAQLPDNFRDRASDFFS